MRDPRSEKLPLLLMEELVICGLHHYYLERHCVLRAAHATLVVQVVALILLVRRLDTELCEIAKMANDFAVHVGAIIAPDEGADARGGDPA